jgi:hypothetical protein
MLVKMKFLGRTMELFGLPPSQKEETVHLDDKALYKDLLAIIDEKVRKIHRDKKYSFYNDIIILSKGRVLKTIEDQPIDHDEITIAPLIAGG